MLQDCTMAVQVKVPTILRSHTGGSKSVEASGDTLDAVLKDVDAKHEGLRARLVDDEGKLHRFVNIYVDDEDVRFNGSLDAPVGENSTVTILPAVAGG
ncbi:MAG: sulfur-carrier protein [Frankiaceae bacterium]|nr:sulfur-carrier protein [Frankiaceae bacterium]